MAASELILLVKRKMKIFIIVLIVLTILVADITSCRKKSSASISDKGAIQNGKKVWTFDADKTGIIPKGFTNVFGEWQVVVDNSSHSNPNVLAQLAKSSSMTFNFTLIGDTDYKDIDISVQIKAVGGSEDQGGGLVWRAKDAKNYYIARYNPLEENYRVYKVEDGKRSRLQDVNIKYNDGWHTLRVTITGNHIECFYDSKKYMDVNDSTFQESGKIGLWIKADAQTHFDDLTVIVK